MSELNSLPPYMRILYNKIYAEKNISGLLDDERIVKLFHFGLKKKIMKDLLRDISKNAHVLQIGLTFGDEIECIYQKIRKQGKLDIFDVSEKQISRAKEKYARKNIEVINYNAACLGMKNMMWLFAIIFCMSCRSKPAGRSWIMFWLV